MAWWKDTKKRLQVTVRRSLPRTAIVVMIFAILAGLVFLQLNGSRQVNDIDTVKLNKYIDSNQCQKVIDETNNVTPDIDTYEKSVNVFEFRGDCQQQLGKNKDALDTYEKLKLLHQKKGNKQAVARTEDTLRGVQANIDYQGSLQQKQDQRVRGVEENIDEVNKMRERYQ